VPETRDVLVTYAGRYGAALHAVHFPVSLAFALRRQRTRPDAEAVPADAMRMMAGKFRWPTPDEYETLNVVEADGKTWAYTPESRWLTDAASRTIFPVRAPWIG
jgi:hypothetical protein